jgi:hypothetical protein
MRRSFIITALVLVLGCGKKETPDPVPPTPPTNFALSSWFIDNLENRSPTENASITPLIRLKFGAKLNRSTVPAAISLAELSGSTVNCNTSFENGDSTVVMTPTSAMKFLTRYKLVVTQDLRSTNGGRPVTESNIAITTRIDSSRKFPAISDDELLTLVQRQTFKYFWDFGHPVSGMARDRNTSGDLVTSGGTGFGVMAIPVAISRGFISRSEGLARTQTIVSFLKNKAQRFHGAYPHFLNGNTGAVIPFSTKDDGADLVETSFLVMGLITSRQYFNGADPAETALRNDINEVCNGVEWSWFRKDNGNVLYWHWSPNYAWDMNLPIRGWNECLVTYVMAAASSTYTIPATVYTSGFAGNGTNGFINGRSFYGYTLPLGENFGGPLFFSHYSFLGIKPNGLTDPYANYQQQVVNHSLINYNHCRINPNAYYGYSDSVWGLTASDIPGNRYTASSPLNDVGVIAPTAALSSFPYTPTESMKALKFFYYVLGDKLWGQYGFKDAFSFKDTWFADSYLAIDQGPIIIMIENHRTGMVWDLFTSAPEVKAGMKKLGFSATYLN